MLAGHLPELLIVLVVALLIFGPKKLPEMGSAVGKSIKEFRKGMNEISNSNSTPAVKDPEISSPRERDSLRDLDAVPTREEVPADKHVD
jgi:sec-independent protein translocase protein TatA